MAKVWRKEIMLGVYPQMWRTWLRRHRIIKTHPDLGMTALVDLQGPLQARIITFPLKPPILGVISLPLPTTIIMANPLYQ